MEAEEQLCVLLAGTLQFLIKIFGLFIKVLLNSHFFLHKDEVCDLRVLVGSYCEPLVPNINQLVPSVVHSKQVALDQLVVVSQAGIISFPCLGCIFSHILHISSISSCTGRQLHSLHGNVTSCTIFSWWTSGPCFSGSSWYQKECKVGDQICCKGLGSRWEHAHSVTTTAVSGKLLCAVVTNSMNQFVFPLCYCQWSWHTEIEDLTTSVCGEKPCLL